MDYLIQSLANSIIQAAGGDVYQQGRCLLRKCLRRPGTRKRFEAEYDITRQRLHRDQGLGAAEANRWIKELQAVLAVQPSARPELQSLDTELIKLVSQPVQVQQYRIAGRDQYNIAGSATFNYRRD
jgi:hypothetical protein